MLANDFTRNGYAELKDFLDGETCIEIKRRIDHTIESGGECACSRPHNTLHMLNWKSAIVQEVLRNNTRLATLIKATGATDLRWISGYISIKEPFSPPLWWHQDWWCWDHEVSYCYPSPQVAMMIYIDATTKHNGALRILPGSHHQSINLHQHLQEAEQMDVTIPEDHASMLPHTDQLLLELQIGDAVVIDYRLLHGTEANATADRRDCIILNFAPHWMDLPSDIRAHLAAHAAQPAIWEKSLLDKNLIQLLPAFNGESTFLNVNRTAPSYFDIDIENESV